MVPDLLACTPPNPSRTRPGRPGRSGRSTMRNTLLAAALTLATAPLLSMPPARAQDAPTAGDGVRRSEQQVDTIGSSSARRRGRDGEGAGKQQAPEQA